MNATVLTQAMKNTPSSDKTALPDPEKDGVDHINVHYNHAKTKLGRQLSTYYVERFEHPYFGPFKCIEGFLLYVTTGCQDDEFRYMTGAKAKAYYREQISAGKLKNHEVVHMGRLLMDVYFTRLVQHPVTATQFKESTLPFDLYFPYRSSGLPIRPEGGALLTLTLITLRTLMKDGKTPVLMTHEECAKLVIR